MEFVGYGEAMELLREHGIREVPDGEERVGLEVAGSYNDVVHLHLACQESTTPPRAGADVVPIEKDRLPNSIDQIIHKLHLTQVLLIPVAK